MRCLGLTGGIGTGKSTAGRILAEWGYPVADTDRIARELLEPGRPALDALVEIFGRDILSDEGRLDRKRLAEWIFSDATLRERVNQILHPRIRSVWMEEVERWRARGDTVGFVVIPLLFEGELESRFDKTLCTACTPATQHARLRDRGWSDDEIERRCASQLPLEVKMARADYVVWSEGIIDLHRAQLKRILAQ